MTSIDVDATSSRHNDVNTMSFLSHVPVGYALADLTNRKILNIWTDRSEQTVEIQIRMLLKEESDQGLLSYFHFTCII